MLFFCCDQFEDSIGCGIFVKCGFYICVVIIWLLSMVFWIFVYEYCSSVVLLKVFCCLVNWCFF
jgi:hypothetical protein